MPSTPATITETPEVTPTVQPIAVKGTPTPVETAPTETTPIVETITEPAPTQPEVSQPPPADPKVIEAARTELATVSKKLENQKKVANAKSLFKNYM